MDLLPDVGMSHLSGSLNHCFIPLPPYHMLNKSDIGFGKLREVIPRGECVVARS